MTLIAFNPPQPWHSAHDNGLPVQCQPVRENQTNQQTGWLIVVNGYAQHYGHTPGEPWTTTEPYDHRP